MTVNSKKRQRRAARALLVLIEHYPKAFFPKEAGGSTRPLKLGIAAELLADKARHGLSKNMLNHCLHAYTHRIRYVQSIVDCVFRIGLDGLPAGKISEYEKQHAERHLVVAKANKAKKKAA